MAWNSGANNGYDLTDIIIPRFLRRFSMDHLSLMDVIESGQVEELRCLENTVGPADAFFSHAPGLPLTTMMQSLKEAEATCEKKMGKQEARFFIDHCCAVSACQYTVDEVMRTIAKIGTTGG
jgi:hypothetical protein